MGDRISLRLGRRDMNVFATVDKPGCRPVVHVAGKHAAALCPSCARPSVTTNGSGWRDVIDVVRTLVITLSVCVRRFVCEHDDCAQRSFDERFEGIDRGGASHRALGWFADLARGRATRAVARDLDVPEHYLRLAVGAKRRTAHGRHRGRLGPHLALGECSVRRNFVYATMFLATAGAECGCGTCPWPSGRWCWCGPSASGAAPTPTARWEPGPRRWTRSAPGRR